MHTCSPLIARCCRREGKTTARHSSKIFDNCISSGGAWRRLLSQPRYCFIWLVSGSAAIWSRIRGRAINCDDDEINHMHLVFGFDTIIEKRQPDLSLDGARSVCTCSESGILNYRRGELNSYGRPVNLTSCHFCGTIQHEFRRNCHFNLTSRHFRGIISLNN